MSAKYDMNATNEMARNSFVTNTFQTIYALEMPYRISNSLSSMNLKNKTHISTYKVVFFIAIIPSNNNLSMILHLS